MNTPLGVLRGQVQLLAGNGHGQEDLDRLARQVSKMERIVQDLLAFGRPQKVEFQAVDARALADRVVEFLCLADPRCRRVAFENGIPADLPPVWGDPSRLEQVLLNLVANAAHATSEENAPAVRIGGEAQGDEVVLVVEDNGCGIPATDLGRVFDPFFTTKQAGEGTGLGLSVSFGIIEEHGGTIEAGSAQGEGTRMVVRLPRSQDVSLAGGRH